MSSRRKIIWISKFLRVSAVSFYFGCGYAAPWKLHITTIDRKGPKDRKEIDWHPLPPLRSEGLGPYLVEYFA
jgi:hypothetical protein